MAEIDDVRAQIAAAAEAGDQATAIRLSTRYRDLQAQAGQLPPVGRFNAESGREYQLAARALSLRRAGREDDADGLIRTITRERVASRINRNGGGAGEAALFGVNRSLLNAGTALSGAGEFVEDTLGGNRNRITARQVMQDSSAVQDAVRAQHPIAAAAGEVGGALATIAVPAAGVARAAQGAGRVARVAAAAGTGAVFGGAQGASDAAVRGQNVVRGAARGAGTGAAVGGGLSILGQVLSPVARGLANRFLDNQGLRRLAEHVSPDQLRAVVNSVRLYQRQFGRLPTLAQAVGMADETVAASAGRIIEGRAPASNVARQQLQPIREQSSRDLAEAVLPGSSTPRGAGGQGGSGRHPITSEETTRAFQAIEGSALVARQGSNLHDFLTRPNVSRLIRRLQPEQRALINNAIDNNGPVTVRMLEHIREKVGNLEKLEGSDFALTEVSSEIKRFADEATRGAYSRALRVHGQNALREGIANEALRSPAAAQRVAGDLATSASRARDLAAELGPAEASRIRGVASVTNRSLRSLDRFEPTQAVSAAEEAANVAGEVVRAAATPKMGGAGTAALLIRSGERLGMTTDEATRFARDFADPSQTPRALAFLRQRIGVEPTMRFMQVLENAGLRPTVERTALVGSRVAAQQGAQPVASEEPAGAPAQAAAEQPEFDVSQVKLSSITQSIIDQAASLEDSAPEQAAQLTETGNRLAQLEQLMMEAHFKGDEEGAQALAAQRQRILDVES